MADINIDINTLNHHPFRPELDEDKELHAVEIKEQVVSHKQLEDRDAPNQHPMSAITGLQDAFSITATAIDGKAPLQHTHSMNDVTNLNTTLHGINNDIGDVDNDLQSAKTNLMCQLNVVGTTPGYLKTYEILQNGQSIGKIDIPKDLVVTSGYLFVKATGDGEPETLVVGKTYLKLVIASGNPIYIDVALLKDVYYTKTDYVVNGYIATTYKGRNTTEGVTDPNWQVKKIVHDNEHALLYVYSATGRWDNRASLVYTLDATYNLLLNAAFTDATQTTSGLMSASDKAKIDSFPATGCIYSKTECDTKFATQVALANGLAGKRDNTLITELSSPTETLSPNIYYYFSMAEVESLDLTLLGDDPTIAEEYMFEFTADADFALTDLNVTENGNPVTWVGEVKSGKLHQCSVLRGVGLIVAVE